MNVSAPARMTTYTRRGDGSLELPFEKPVVVPNQDDSDPAAHAWADARFWTDIMSEHAFFFALLMPEEVASKERAEALHFSRSFADLHSRIDADGVPARTNVASFSAAVAEQVKPFIDFKARLGDAQRSGQLRSLVWPLFFDHTREEAERFSRRLDLLARGETEFERSEVATFWADIMEQHGRFIAHLLDPDEVQLVAKATGVSASFRAVDVRETDALMALADTVLEFKTEAARGIEAARVKSIIDPRLADHVRREALKFIDELKRAV